MTISDEDYQRAVAQKQEQHSRAVAAERPLRALTLYDWQAESFDLARCPEILARSVELARMTPNKLSVKFEKNGRVRVSNIRKPADVLDKLKALQAYLWVALDDAIDGNFSNLNSQAAFTQKPNYRRIQVANVVKLFDIDQCVEIIRLFSATVALGYGFTHVAPQSIATFFSAGVVVVGDPDQLRGNRATVLREGLGFGDHRLGLVHDIYELNVLAPVHMERRIGGKSLREWIGAGERGRLIDVSANNSVWLVPDALQASIRNEFAFAELLFPPRRAELIDPRIPVAGDKSVMN